MRAVLAEDLFLLRTGLWPAWSTTVVGHSSGLRELQAGGNCPMPMVRQTF